ncbi:phage holin family protein [Belliella sp. DSM 107340]|uniref:Phage holin family protein n=1 Tax=Belliella calami TaxID=2923436 RepID=A0ABS9UJG3_9BACT|nr:phage holin family protein [Belliella calami]MCH7396570.1 phage holin family protein [Belliella calami]
MIFGYSSFDEYIEAVFKHVNSEIVIKYLIPLILLINLVFNYLFVSAGGIYFLMILYCIDFLTGVAKSIKYSLEIVKLKKDGLPIPKEIEDKKLVSKKFPRFLLTLFAALILLSILKFAGIYSIVFMPLYSIFYAVFLGQQIISISENFFELKLIPIDVVSKLKTKINELKK